MRADRERLSLVEQVAGNKKNQLKEDRSSQRKVAPKDYRISIFISAALEAEQ